MVYTYLGLEIETTGSQDPIVHSRSYSIHGIEIWYSEVTFWSQLGITAYNEGEKQRVGTIHQMSMHGGDHLPSDEPPAHLSAIM